MQFHIGLEPFVHHLFGDDGGQPGIFLPELTTIICSDTCGDDTSEDDVDDERYDQEFKDEHIAPPSAK